MITLYCQINDPDEQAILADLLTAGLATKDGDAISTLPGVAYEPPFRTIKTPAVLSEDGETVLSPPVWHDGYRVNIYIHHPNEAALVAAFRAAQLTALVELTPGPGQPQRRVF